MRLRTQPPVVIRRRRRVPVRHLAAREPAADSSEEPVGRGVQQQAALVGDEAMTA